MVTAARLLLAALACAAIPAQAAQSLVDSCQGNCATTGGGSTSTASASATSSTTSSAAGGSAVSAGGAGGSAVSTSAGGMGGAGGAGGNATGGAGGQATTGPVSVNVGPTGGTGTGGSSSATGGSATGGTSAATAAGGSATGGSATGGTASGGSAHASAGSATASAGSATASAGSASSSLTVNTQASRAAYAPDVLATPTAPCRVAVGASAGWLGGALGLSTSVLDEGCDIRETARVLWALGQRDAAIRAMCQHEVARRALAAACE